jgi:hypothetical protein
MTTLDIGGKRVKVGDEFLSQSPEEQQRTVNEIAAQMGIGAAPAARPEQQRSGLLENIAAATKAVAYGAAGAPVDLARAAINVSTQADDPLGRALRNAPIIGPIVTATQNLAGTFGVPAVPENTIGSSKFLAEQGEKLGIVDPDKVVAQTLPEKIARSATEAALLTVAPELLLARLKQFGIVGQEAVKMAESILGSAKSTSAVARNALAGATGGAGATIGMEVAPEPLKPLAAVLGALVGGVGGDLAVTGAGSAARRVGETVEGAFGASTGPAGVERAAGRKLAAGLDGTIDETITAIDSAAAPVSGTKPTLAQVTDDRGAATMAKGAAKADPIKFEERAAQQAQDRVDFLRRVQRTGGAEDMAPAITRNNQRVEDLLAKIDDVEIARGTAIRDDIAAGRLDPVEAGESLRGLLATGREARRRVESALHEAVDPDGTLVTRTNSLRDTAKRMGTQRSTLAKPIAGEERAIIETVDALEPVTPYKDLVALKTRIGDEMRLEARTNGKTAKWGRLSQYAKAVAKDLKAPAAALAKEEAAAVKAGEIAPENTFVARIRVINDELDRNAASFGTLDDGTGALSAGPPPTGPRDFGAAGPTGVGSADATGGSNLPKEEWADFVVDNEGRAFNARAAKERVQTGGPEGIVDDALSAAARAQDEGTLPPIEGIIDPDVAARLRAADAATIERVNTFDNKTLKHILARPSSVNPFTMPASQIPARIFRPGPAGGETMAQYRAAVGDAQALPVIEGYAIDDLMRVALRPDGTLDPKKVTKWRNDHADALRSFPALDARLANATTATETAGAVAATRRAQVTEAQKGAASALAGATDPGEITTIVGKIFGRADKVEQMQKLRRALRNDPDANAGLRKTIVDHMLSKVVKDVDGTDALAPERLRAFIDDNEQALRAAGFTDPEIRSMRALADEASQAARIAKSARPDEAGAGDVAQNILRFGLGPRATPRSLFLRMAVQSAGYAILPIIFGGGPVAALAALIGAGAVNALRAKGLQSVDELFREALLDPALARKLLAKVNNKNLKPVVNSFRQQLTRSTLGGTLAATGDSGNQTSSR